MKGLTLPTTSLALCVAFGGVAYGQDKVVTYRSWSPVIQTLEKMVAATEAANPGIEVDVKTFNYGEYLVDLQTRTIWRQPRIARHLFGAMTGRTSSFRWPSSKSASATLPAMKTSTVCPS